MPPARVRFQPCKLVSTSFGLEARLVEQQRLPVRRDAAYLFFPKVVDGSPDVLLTVGAAVEEDEVSRTLRR